MLRALKVSSRCQGVYRTQCYWTYSMHCVVASIFATLIRFESPCYRRSYGDDHKYSVRINPWYLMLAVVYVNVDKLKS